MSAWVSLSVVQGPFKGEVYHFDHRTLCTIGRAHDCQLRFPPDARHMSVSRHHCRLDIDPPHVTVRDLGSRNGTYVNGVNAGQRPNAEIPGEAILLELPRFELNEADDVRIGDTVFRVHVEDPGARPEAESEHGVESSATVGAGI